MEDAELARRSIRSFGEMAAALGRAGAGAEVRRPDAVGARIPSAAANPWFDAVVVPLDAAPPADGPDLPGCVWTVADAVPGRREHADIAMPCMGLALADLPTSGEEDRPAVPDMSVLGAVNDRAYGETEAFTPLVRGLADERIRAHGLRADAAFACVALTLRLGDDLGIHYVATEPEHRRRGLAARLLRAVLAEARADGLRTATLQSSPDGLRLYQGLGFRTVATLRAFVRPA